MWNPVNYFENICKTLKLTSEKYHFCRVTGINFLEDVLQNLKSEQAFFAVDDTDDGTTVRQGGAFYNRRSVVIYIIQKYRIQDQNDREKKLAETRTIREKILAKLIKDSAAVPELFYLNRDRMPYFEVPGFFAPGACGNYFIVTFDEPANLCHDESDWK